MKKSNTNKRIAGVIAGIAESADINVTLLRFVAILLLLSTGLLAVFAYVGMAIAMDKDE